MTQSLSLSLSLSRPLSLSRSESQPLSVSVSLARSLVLSARERERERERINKLYFSGLDTGSFYIQPSPIEGLILLILHINIHYRQNTKLVVLPHHPPPPPSGLHPLACLQPPANASPPPPPPPTGRQPTMGTCNCRVGLRVGSRFELLRVTSVSVSPQLTGHNRHSEDVGGGLTDHLYCLALLQHGSSSVPIAEPLPYDKNTIISL